MNIVKELRKKKGIQQKELAIQEKRACPRTTPESRRIHAITAALYYCRCTHKYADMRPYHMQPDMQKPRRSGVAVSTASP